MSTTPQTTQGETSLPLLLQTLNPVLSPTTYVFTTHPTPYTPPVTLTIQMQFREPSHSSITIITTKTDALSHAIPYVFPCRMITLEVHSSLAAVGFMAKISGKLTEKGVGCNPVSGFYHDYLFVAEGSEGLALEVLDEVKREALAVGNVAEEEKS